MRNSIFSSTILFVVSSVGCPVASQVLPLRHDNTGIGLYPANPNENFAPRLQVDTVRRNIALNRRAFASQSADYNLTAQLVTDGVISKGEYPTLTVTDNGVVTNRYDRERMLDFGQYSRNDFSGDKATFNIDVTGYEIAADKVTISGRLFYDSSIWNGNVKAYCYGSKDGKKWKKLAQESLDYDTDKNFKLKESDDPNKQSRLNSRRSVELEISLNLRSVKEYKHWKFELESPGANMWQIVNTVFYNDGQIVDTKPYNHFYSAWMDAGVDKPWLSVDLGSDAQLYEVKLHWVTAPASGSIEVSDNGADWHPVATYNSNGDKATVVTLPAGTHGRYVKTPMNRNLKGQPIVVTEMEVIGTGGMTPVPASRPAPSNGIISLSGGDWQLWRAVGESGEEVSAESFIPVGNIMATVPATVLTSYKNVEAIADPNYADAENDISDSFFNSDFWYRTEFEVPEEMIGRQLTLNFDGINWKARVYVNGEATGEINGAFKRGIFDITDKVKPGKNILAVKIIKAAHPGAIKEKSRNNPGFNGGILGADNPTFHASIGWDWISTIRGRNIGIWNDVYVTSHGDVTVSDPYVQTHLRREGETTIADLTCRVFVQNHSGKDFTGTLQGTIGDIDFAKAVNLKANESKDVVFSWKDYPQLSIKNPALWWPNGYGEPVLHKASFVMKTGNEISDEIDFNVGLRELTYSDNPEEHLEIYVNGERFVGRGGNWGMSEANLNFRGQEYDAAVAYHKDMNMNIIRNWVGMTGDEEFYDACDRHGIMIWQDFWLANPADGPDPDDNAMFMDNAVDYIKRIRRHPALALYCGRNEGNPPAEIDNGLTQSVAQLQPGIIYIPNSADRGVSGHGPYKMLDAKEYFELKSGNSSFHTERGMPNVLTYDGMRHTFSPAALEDFDNKEWGMHDYTNDGAQGARSFNDLVSNLYGTPANTEEFSRKAQMVNYDGHRSMFESRSVQRQGLLMWMSHSCWPSMVWQTYDYFMEPTAGYFGIKKASEPLHIQWNPVNYNVEAVNYSVPDKQSLTAIARLIDLDGNVVKCDSIVFDSPRDTTLPVINFTLPGDEEDVYVIDLALYDGDKIISENRYIQSTVADGSKQRLNTLPAGELKAEIIPGTSNVPGYETTSLTITNTGKTIIPSVRLNLVGDSDREQILPVLYSDNYFILLPGESKTVDISWHPTDARGQHVGVEIGSYHGSNLLYVTQADK